MLTTRVLKKGTRLILDVLGPTIEFLTSPEEAAACCTLIGTIPPGGVIPLHHHADFEDFYQLSGTVQVISEQNGTLEWLDVTPGDFVRVPGNAKHAFRNLSNEPVVQLIVTTPRLGRFFQELGKPFVPGAPPRKPAPDVLEHFLRVSADYGYWNASPEENAAIGISLLG